MFKPLSAQFVAGNGKKVEALEFLGTGASSGFILGTDDENLGGYVLVMPPKP